MVSKAAARKKKAKLLRRKNGKTAPILSLGLNELTVGEMRFLVEVFESIPGLLKYLEARTIYDKTTIRLKSIQTALEVGGKKNAKGKTPK